MLTAAFRHTIHGMPGGTFQKTLEAGNGAMVVALRVTVGFGRGGQRAGVQRDGERQKRVQKDA